MRASLVTTLLILLEAAASGGEPLAFERFSYEQEPRLGFCPPLSTVFAAEIIHEPPEQYFVTLEVLEVVPTNLAGADCVDIVARTPEGACAVVRELAPRKLSTEEAEKLKDLFGQVHGRLEAEPGPLCGAFDPCLARVFSWDGLRASDDPCAELRVRPEDVLPLLLAIEDLRLPGALVENGDTNGDGQRDLSDGVYLLTHLFLGGPSPVDARCPELIPCHARQLSVIQNGDTNGDAERNVTDAVALLNWLFLGAEAPASLCTCLDAACEEGTCPEGDLCFPLRPEIGGTICLSDITTCGHAESIYEFLISADGEDCRADVGCHVLRGHCRIGVGACYQVVSRSVRQAHLDALAERFIELGGVGACPRGLCEECPPPPAGATCREGTCREED